eukprot:TRINITY_DN12713_c0_g1_i1.p1 TRINITY_DN12713_c0_g1~~TRINITY_DN12713_c0_g1_i1.p1  ORF type:complete len:326 (+),score=58.70 TRINITY_DN12713_c0_g1_i1:60-980(+)
MALQMRKCLLRGFRQAGMKHCNFVANRWVPCYGQQLRWNSSSASSDNSFDDMFSSIDKHTYRDFNSVQTNLINDEGRRVSIIPMQHIASAEFYDSIVKEVARNNYYLCLIEGVLDSVQDLENQDQLCFRLATDEKFKDTCLAAINNQCTPEEESAMFKEYHMPDPPKELNLKLMEVYFKPRLLLSSPLKVKNSDVLREKILEIKDPKDREFFVLNGRTDHCGKVLREYLNQPIQEYADCPGADSIAVCWGDAHCADLVDDLVVRGFRVESTERREYGWTEDLYAEVMKNSTNHTNDENFMKILGTV